ALHGRALRAAEAAARPERAEALRLFAANLNKAFYGFEPDFFQQNLLRIVDDVISAIKGPIELWPTLVEICYFQKGRKGLPQVRVKNQKKQERAAALVLPSLLEGEGRSSAAALWRIPRMRIAQIAPLYESVPPKLYGGTERVVSWLTE